MRRSLNDELVYSLIRILPVCDGKQQMLQAAI